MTESWTWHLCNPPDFYEKETDVIIVIRNKIAEKVQQHLLLSPTYFETILLSAKCDIKIINEHLNSNVLSDAFNLPFNIIYFSHYMYPCLYNP